MTLHKQAASLLILHAADVLQPLLILPYAGMVLGPTAFGQYAYILALAQLASVTVDYGFSLTARRAAASARHDAAQIRTILAEVFAAKAILLLGIVALGLAARSIGVSINMPIFLCIILAAVGGILFPSWLFIALERPWLATIAVVVARTIALLAFFVLVKSPSDAYLAAAIQTSIPLVSAVISVRFVISIGLGGFSALTWRSVVKQLREGWRGFISYLASTLVISLPVPLVQHFAGFAAAGQYSVAEKLITATRPLFRVMGETLMPRVAYLASHNPAKGLTLIWTSLWTLVVGASLSLFLYFAGPLIIVFFFGPEFEGAIAIIRILYIIPIFLNVSLCMSSLYMFNYGHERAWTVLIVSGLITFMAASYLLSYWMDGALAVAIGSVVGECLVAVVSAIFFAASVLGKGRSARISGAADA